MMGRNINEIFSDPQTAEYPSVVEALVNAPVEERSALLGKISPRLQQHFFVETSKQLIEDDLTNENLEWINDTIKTTTSRVEPGMEEKWIDQLIRLKTCLVDNQIMLDPDKVKTLSGTLTDSLSSVCQIGLTDRQKTLFKITLKEMQDQPTLQKKIDHLLYKQSHTHGNLFSAYNTIHKSLAIEAKSQTPVFHDISHLTGLDNKLDSKLDDLVYSTNHTRRVLLGEGNPIDNLAYSVKAKIKPLKDIKSIKDITSIKNKRSDLSLAALEANRIRMSVNVEHTKEVLANKICKKPEPNTEDIQWVRQYLSTLAKKDPTTAWHTILGLRMELNYSPQLNHKQSAMDQMLASLQDTIQPSKKHFGFLRNIPKPREALMSLEDKMLSHFQDRLSQCKKLSELNKLVKEFEASGHGALICHHDKLKPRYDEMVGRKRELLTYISAKPVKLGYEDTMETAPSNLTKEQLPEKPQNTQQEAPQGESHKPFKV